MGDWEYPSSCSIRHLLLALPSYNRDSFWKFVWEKVKTRDASYIGGFWWSQCEIRGLTSEILTVSDNRWSCGRAIFQGNPAIKTSKTSSPLHNNIVLGILDHWQTSNQFDMTISVGDISFSVVFTCCRSEIRETHRRSNKKYFFNK